MSLRRLVISTAAVARSSNRPTTNILILDERCRIEELLRRVCGKDSDSSRRGGARSSHTTNNERYFTPRAPRRKKLPSICLSVVVIVYRINSIETDVSFVSVICISRNFVGNTARSRSYHVHSPATSPSRPL
jgi:hypothetical protein